MFSKLHLNLLGVPDQEAEIDGLIRCDDVVTHVLRMEVVHSCPNFHLLVGQY